MRQLQGMDASFVAMETPNSPMHIGSVLIYNPQTAPGKFVRFKDILGFLEARMQMSRTMRQRMVQVPFNLDYPYWIEDANFDLEYHVRHVALPKPGDWRQLCIQAARIFSRPLDLNRPPWEFTVVEGLDNIDGVAPGSYAMVTKVHHSAIDGMSGVDLLEALNTLEPDAPPPSEPDTWKPERIPGAPELFGKSYMSALTNPFKQLEVAAKAAPGLAKAIKGLAAKEFKVNRDMIAPRTRFNKTLSSARVVEGRSVPLADIKAIRVLADNSKVNDVFLAIIGGALRRYLLAKDELPRKSLTAMAPISVREKNEKGDMGNQVAAMVAQLGTQIEDASERLAYVTSKTANSKAMTNAMGARNMTEISKVSPALYMALGAQLYTRLGLANRVNPPFSTIVTNVPGPPIPVYSTGAKLESHYGLVCLTDGMGLGHVVQSYCDEATISFTACRELLPDPEFYSQCIQDSFEELRDAALTASGAGKADTKTGSASAKAATAKTKASEPASGEKPAVPKTAARKASAKKVAPKAATGTTSGLKPARSTAAKPKAAKAKAPRRPRKTSKKASS